jgi:SHS2 domain-containing protein
LTYRFVDHTADCGVEVAAPSLAALFAEAAAAFTDTVTVRETVAPAEERRFELAAERLDDLLVAWLEELLYAFEVDGLLFREAEVEVGEGANAEAAAGHHLRAIARGEAYDPDRHPVKVLVKGVTYHALVVRRQPDGGWLARVIFDI